MPDNELYIYLKMEAESAAQTSRAYHAGEQARIRATAQLQAKTEKDAAKARHDALKQIESDVKSSAARMKATWDEFYRRQSEAKQKEVDDFLRAESVKQKTAGAESRRTLNSFLRDEGQLRRTAKRDAERDTNDMLRNKRKAFAEELSESSRTTKGIVANEKSVQRSAEGTSEAVMGVARAYTTLRIASEVSQAITGALQTMAQSTNAAREHIVKLVDQMERARTLSKELANLEGKSPTATYTAEIAQRAAATGSDVEDYQRGQLSMQAFAAQYLGKENATDAEKAEEARQGKIGFEEAQDVNKDWSTNLGAQGIKQDEGMQLFGTVLGKQKKGATPEDIKLSLRRTIEIAKRTKGFTGPMLKQFQEVISETVGEGGEFKTIEEAAIMTRQVAERNPEEASAYMRAAIRELRELQNDPKKESQLEELGITKGMSFKEKIAAIDQAARAYEATGEGTQNEFIGKHFKEARAFGGVRESIMTGLRNGGITRAESEARAITNQTMSTENRRYLQSEEGQAATRRSRKRATELEASRKYVELQRWKDNAEMAVVGSGELEQSEGLIGSALTKSGEVLGYGNRKEQLTRSETARQLEMALQGSKEGRAWLGKQKRYRAQVGDFSRGLGRTFADESKLAEAAAIVRKNNPAVNFTPDPNKTDPENMAAQQQAMREMHAAAKDLRDGARGLKDVVKPQVKAPIAAAPKVMGR